MFPFSRRQLATATNAAAAVSASAAFMLTTASAARLVEASRLASKKSSGGSSKAIPVAPSPATPQPPASSSNSSTAAPAAAAAAASSSSVNTPAPAAVQSKKKRKGVSDTSGSAAAVKAAAATDLLRDREEQERRRQAAMDLIKQATAKMQAARNPVFISEEQAQKQQLQQQQQQQSLGFTTTATSRGTSLMPETLKQQQQQQQGGGAALDSSSASSSADATALTASPIPSSSSTTTASAAASGASFATNRICWQDVQAKIQAASVQLASCRPNTASEITNGARAMIRQFEMTYVFLPNDPNARVCVAEHEDELTPSIAAELVSSALRFAVPVHSPFVSGLLAYLCGCLQRGEAAAAAAVAAAAAPPKQQDESAATNPPDEPSSKDDGATAEAAPESAAETSDSGAVEPAASASPATTTTTTSTAAASSSSSAFFFADRVNGPAYLTQLVNGAGSVGQLRVWDERVFHRFQGVLRATLQRTALRDVMGILTAIGSKELGATRVKHAEELDAGADDKVSSSTSNNNEGFGASESAAASSTAHDGAATGTTVNTPNSSSGGTAASPSQSLLLTPSQLVPCLFAACLEQLDALVADAVAALRQNPGNRGASSVMEAVMSFADSPLSSDHMLRARLRVWLPQIIDSVPAASFRATVLAAGTLRIENVFHLSLRRANEICVLDNSSSSSSSSGGGAPAASTTGLAPQFTVLRIAQQAGTLTTLMHLPRKRLSEVRFEFDFGDKHRAASSVAFFERPLVERQQQQQQGKDAFDAYIAAIIDVAKRHAQHQLNAQRRSGGGGSSAQSSDEQVELRAVSLTLGASKKTATTVDLMSTSAPPSPSGEQPISFLLASALSKSSSDKPLVCSVQVELVPKTSSSSASSPAPPSKQVQYLTALDVFLFSVAERIMTCKTRFSMNGTRLSSVLLARRDDVDVCADLAAFLGGAVGIQVTAHPAVQGGAAFFFNRILGGGTGPAAANDSNSGAAAVAEAPKSSFAAGSKARLTAELEFLALAPHFRGRDETRRLLESVLQQVRATLREVDMRNHERLLDTNQLRLLCTSTLAVKYDIPADVATFLLANFVELAGEANLNAVSAVLYTVGRTGIVVPEGSHAVVARRLAAILRFSKSSQRFTSRGSGGNVDDDMIVGGAELTAHDLAVTLSGLHLTKFRWDHHPRVFNDLAEAIAARRKRYSPAQCCQIVAIARDIARWAQQRQKTLTTVAVATSNTASAAAGGGGGSDGANSAAASLRSDFDTLYQLSTNATKLARVFLPQIRHSIPAATETDLLPLLAWLSTGHIRDVSLLDLIVERLIALNAQADICMSVLESVHCMGLLGGLNSDGVLRLVADVAVTRDQATPEQAAQLAFYITQLRGRDVQLVRILVTKAKKGVKSGNSSSSSSSSDAASVSEDISNSAHTIKSLCCAIGALSLVQVPWTSPEMRALTAHLERAMAEYDRAQSLREQQEEAAELEEQRLRQERERRLREAEEEGEDEKDAATTTAVEAKDGEQTLAAGNLPKSPPDMRPPPPDTPEGKAAAKLAADDTNEHLRQQILSPKSSTAAAAVVGGVSTNNGGAVSAYTTSKQPQTQPRKSVSAGVADIDVECLIFAMTAVAADEATPAAERARFLNRMCSILDAQLSMMPALRSQRLAKTNNRDASANNSNDGGSNSVSSNSSLRAAIAASSARALPVTSLTNMLSEIAAQNLPVFSVFRVCGKVYVAPGTAQLLTPADAVKALSAYAAFSFRDDFVVRTLCARCFALKKSIAGNAMLARQCNAAMAAFHVSFDAHDGQPARVADALRAGGARRAT